MNKRIWWLHPVVLYAGVTLLALAAYALPEEVYALIYGAEKCITKEHLLLYGVMLLLFAVGYGLSGRGRYSGVLLRASHVDAFDEERAEIASLHSAYRCLYAVCVGAYALWYGNFLRIHGAAVLGWLSSADALSAAMYTMREQAGRITGITTFTELSMVVLPLGLWLLRRGDASLRASIRWQLGLLVALACLRAVAFSERMALLEMLVPGAVMLAVLSAKGRWVKWVPLAAVAVVVAVFGVMEYSRSWLQGYQELYESYGQFVLLRLMGYYANAINAECMMLAHAGPSGLPWHTLMWLWEMPGMAGWYDLLAPSNVPQVFQALLQTWGNPEFNNPGGMLALVLDFGAAFPVVQVIFGYMAGRAYRRCCQGNVLGMLVYAHVFLCLVELPRFFLLGASRSFIVGVGLLVVIILAQFRKRRGR